MVNFRNPAVFREDNRPSFQPSSRAWKAQLTHRFAVLVDKFWNAVDGLFMCVYLPSAFCFHNASHDSPPHPQLGILDYSRL